MNLLDNYYEELCELIYQINSDKKTWFHLAKRLCELLNASYVHIQAIDFSYKALSYSYGVGILPDLNYAKAELDFLRYPLDQDPRWEKFLDPQRQGWYQCHSHITDEFVKNSDLYQKILLPVHIRYMSTHELIWDETLCVFWSFSTAADDGPLNQEELAFLDRLMPHMKRVMLANRRHFEFSLDNIVGYNLIDKLPQPVMLLNLAGQNVHQNQAAAYLISKYSCITFKDNRLVLPSQDQARFDDFLYHIEVAFRYSPEQLSDLNHSEFNVFNTTLQFSTHVLASEKERSFFGIRPLLMLTFKENMVTVLKSKQQLKHKYTLLELELKQLFQLTKREIELCHFFVNGLNLKKIASEMELTENSIRTYLKNIFSKTACSTQTELMHFLIDHSTTCSNEWIE